MENDFVALVQECEVKISMEEEAIASGAANDIVESHQVISAINLYILIII